MSVASHPSQPAEYAANQIKQFLGACCQRDRAGSVRSGELYVAYLNWLPAPASRLHQTQFSLTLEGLGFVGVRSRKGVYFEGIRWIQ